VLAHEKTALLVPPNDLEALAQAIVRLSRDKDLRLRLGSSARDHVVKHYTWDKHVARILDRVRKMGWLDPGEPRIPEEATPRPQEQSLGNFL
jgi:glycosyltransferase involved in cell wall biosynthesis